MTAQIHDSILFNKKNYFIVGLNGSDLFEPEALGIFPFAVMSACWRGYVSHYKVSHKKLWLDRLEISIGYPDDSGAFVSQAGPAINGVSPTGKSDAFNNIYKSLNLEIPFTGGLLAGADFIQELYVHMGFHPAWKYQTVFELIFDNGLVQEIRDVSRQLERMRSQKTHQPLTPDFRKYDPKTVETWIEDTFKLDYNLD